MTNIVWGTFGGSAAESRPLLLTGYLLPRKPAAGQPSHHTYGHEYALKSAAKHQTKCNLVTQQQIHVTLLKYIQNHAVQSLPWHNRSTAFAPYIWTRYCIQISSKASNHVQFSETTIHSHDIAQIHSKPRSPITPMA